MKGIGTYLILLIVLACNPPQKGEVDQAYAQDTLSELAIINKRIADDPSNPALYVERARYYEGEGLLVRAAEEFDRAKVANPEIVDHYSEKAKILMKLKNYKGASEELEKGLAMDSEHIPCNLLLSELLLRAQRYPEARWYADSVLKKDVYNAHAYYLKGMSFKASGDTATAISSFLTATEQDNMHYEAYLQLGLLFAKGRDELAVGFYDNAIRIDPENAEPRYNRALFLQSYGEYEKALNGYLDIVEFDSSNYLALYNTGFLYLTQLEEYDTAIFYFERAIVSEPKAADAIYNMGLCYEMKGDNARALDLYRNTLQIAPAHTLAAKGISRVEG